ncbi:MAG TPA: ATP-binding protein [Candidatus Acidoferrum sp.]|nr:ATP-binding protein [Candidatus Acidoferrum sp.]
MRISIKYKLFFIFLLANGLAYAATYSVWYYNFNRGFLEYVSRIEERQVPALIKGLETFYHDNGSWEAILKDNAIFLNLIAGSIESSADADLIEARSRRIKRPVPNRSIFQVNDWYYSSEYSPARPYLQLLDANKHIIRGTPGAPSLDVATLNPILVDGKTVGYLAVTSRQQLSEQGDLLFKEQQQNDFFKWALELGLLTALLAFPAASFLTRPVRQMVEGARALTSGDYASRIPVRGSDELTQLSEDFNALAKALQQNQQARQQWIADISHELRTPLAVMRGELEAVQDGVRPLNKETLDSLHQEVLHLNTLVNDLHELSLSDIGALIYKKEPLDLADILHTCLDKHIRAAGSQLRIVLKIRSSLPDESLPMIGDPDRLLQLFDNLLQNSQRYTDAGGELQVHAHDDGRHVLVEWLDSAPGVGDKDLAHLFDRLYRVEMSRNRAKGGSGLGLAICQNIVTAHNGTIAANHSPLGGLRLTIAFPRTIELLSD